MLKDISKLKGINILTKEEQKLVNGASGGCLYACFCHHTNTNPLCCCVN